MANLYDILYNRYMQDGYTAPTDSGEWGSQTQAQYRPVTLDDGRQLIMDPSTNRLIVAGRDGNTENIEYYNQDGTTSRESRDYQANDWKKSLLGAITTLGGSALAANFLGPMLAEWAGAAGFSPAGTQALSTSLGQAGMDTAGLDALIAQQSVAYPSIAAPTMAGTAASEFALPGGALSQIPEAAPTMAGVAASEYALPGGALSDIASAPAAAGAVAYGTPSSLSQLGGVAGGSAAGQMATSQQPAAPNQQPSVLERLMNGTQGPNDWMQLLSGGLGAYNQYNFGQDLLERANQATPNRGFYEDTLRQTYENPGSYLNGPDATAAMDIMHNKIQRSDAGRGQLGNTIGREVTLNNYMMENLNKYRTGLAGIVGDNQRTYSGQNSIAAQGMAANNSATNGLLYPLLQQSMTRG